MFAICCRAFAWHQRITFSQKVGMPYKKTDTISHCWATYQLENQWQKVRIMIYEVNLMYIMKYLITWPRHIILLSFRLLFHRQDVISSIVSTRLPWRHYIYIYIYIFQFTELHYHPLVEIPFSASSSYIYDYVCMYIYIYIYKNIIFEQTWYGQQSTVGLKCNNKVCWDMFPYNYWSENFFSRVW